MAIISGVMLEACIQNLLAFFYSLKGAKQSHSIQESATAEPRGSRLASLQDRDSNERSGNGHHAESNQSGISCCRPWDALLARHQGEPEGNAADRRQAAHSVRGGRGDRCG